MLTQCDRDRAMNEAKTQRERGREGRAQSRDGDRTLRQR